MDTYDQWNAFSLNNFFKKYFNNNKKKKIGSVYMWRVQMPFQLFHLNGNEYYQVIVI